jgi:hypothetical protein
MIYAFFDESTHKLEHEVLAAALDFTSAVDADAAYVATGLMTPSDAEIFQRYVRSAIHRLPVLSIDNSCGESNGFSTAAANTEVAAGAEEVSEIRSGLTVV